MNTKEDIDRNVSKYLKFLENSINTPFILANFEKRSISLQKLTDLKTNIEQVYELRKTQHLTKAEKNSISKQTDLLFGKIFSKYIELIEIGRLFLKEDDYVCELLELKGKRKDSVPGFTVQGKLFYENLIELLKTNENCKVFGITEPEIKLEIEKINELSVLSTKHTKEIGETVQTTIDKDELFNKSEKEVLRLIALARIIFKDYPAYLKMLGIK